MNFPDRANLMYILTEFMTMMIGFDNWTGHDSGGVIVRGWGGP
jgi:hypothetical protein